MIIEVSAVVMAGALLAYTYQISKTIRRVERLGFRYERELTMATNKHLATSLYNYAASVSDHYEAVGKTTDAYYEATLYELGLSRQTIAELRCPHKIANRCLEIVKALKA